MYNKESTSYNQIISLEINNNEIRESYTMAQSFNEFFIDVTDNIDISTETLDKDYMNQFSPQITIPFNFDKTTNEEIENIIKSLKSSAATGYDNISTKFIKRYSVKLAPIICKLINSCLEKSEFPESLKRAIVTPIHKTGSQSLCNNYRPISVLNSLSKIFETVIKIRLQKYFHRNGLIHKSQYGFEKNSNTTAACLDMTDFV